MGRGDFWKIPENRRFVSRVLVAVILVFSAILFFRSCHKPESVNAKKYLAKLSSSTAEVRMDAVMGLARLGIKKSLPELEKIMTADPDEKVQRSAAYAVFTLDREKFLAYLDAPSEKTRITCLETLGRQEKDKAYTYLEKALRDPALPVRLSAFRLLIQFAPGQSEDLVLKLAEKTSEDTALRIEAIGFLGKSSLSEAVTGSFKSLASSWSEPTEIRKAASAALKEIEQKKKEPTNQEKQ